jgi:hypothetical protein
MLHASKLPWNYDFFESKLILVQDASCPLWNPHLPLFGGAPHRLRTTPYYTWAMKTENQ